MTNTKWTLYVAVALVGGFVANMIQPFDIFSATDAIFMVGILTGTILSSILQSSKD